MRLLPLLLLGLFAAGCAPSGAVGTASDDALAGPTWRLVTLAGERPAGPEATITFGADGRVSGTTGCNRFTGTYRLAPEGSLSLSPLATTRMACRPPAGEQERRVLDALATAERASVQRDRLVLLGANGDRLLTFEAVPGATAEATLTGTVTYLPRIALPPDAVVIVRLLDVSLADAPSVTLAEQTLSTEDRRVPIPFQLAYDASEIQPRHRYTVRAEIRDSEGTLLWITDTAHPVLTNGAPADGVEVRVVQVGESTGALVGPMWRLVEIEAGSGGVLLPGDRPHTITFGTDGRYSGQADCNRYGGSFEAGADGSLRLSQGLSTLAACPPPSASADFFRVLNGAESYVLTGDRLRVTGSEGALVFERESQGGMLPQETGRDTSYTCESPDGPFTFRIRTGPGEIALWLPARFEGRDGGTYRVLGQVQAASGAKYQDGPVEVWAKGTDQARLVVDDETFTGCRA